MKRHSDYFFLLIGMSGCICAMEELPSSHDILLEWDTGSPITTLAYSSDCKHIATGHLNKVCLWDRVNGTKIKQYVFKIPVSSLQYNDRDQGFTVFLKELDEEVEMIGTHAPDGRTSAVGDYNGRMRIYKGPLYYFLEEAKKAHLSEKEWQLAQKIASNEGAPIDLTGEDKATYDGCPLLHSFFTVSIDAKNQQSYKIKQSQELSSMRSAQQWRLLHLVSKVLWYPLLFFKQYRPNPITYS